MDLDQHSLKKFMAVVEELNFNRAAQRLHVSQPALSQAVRRLEVDLGKSLFERDSHGVVLTEFGRTFYVIARTLVTQHDKAVAAALQAARGELNPFRVGYSHLVDLTVVSAIRLEFARKEPDARIEILCLPDAEQIVPLIAGKLDAALLIAPKAVQALTMEVLGREPLVVGLTHDHRLARQKLLSLDDVRGEPLIWWPRNFNPLLFDWLFATCTSAAGAPQIVQEATTLPESLELVAQGHGITFLPRSTAAFKHAGVAFRELAGEPLSVETVAVYRQDDESRILSRFLAYVKGRFRTRL
jgi:DNA-binding transcriptional LysR family regulator